MRTFLRRNQSSGRHEVETTMDAPSGAHRKSPRRSVRLLTTSRRPRIFPNLGLERIKDSMGVF